MVIKLFHFLDRLLHQAFDDCLEFSFPDLFHPFFEMFALGREIFSRQAAGKLRHLWMRDSCRTTRGAHAAHDAVETLFRALFVFAALGVSDILHDVEPLGTAFRAGVAAYAGINFGIELHHDLLRGLYLFNIVNLLHQREKGQRRHIHALLHLRLAGEASL